MQSKYFYLKAPNFFLIEKLSEWIRAGGQFDRLMPT
jgi:hypothetical protein